MKNFLIYNKKLVLILGLSFALFFLLIIVFFLFSNKRTGYLVPKETVILKKEGLEIKNVFPEPNHNNAGIFTDVYVDFSRPVDNTEKNNVSLLINPFVKTSYFWSNNNSRLNAKLEGGLEVDTAYILRLDYFNKKYSWGFTTAKIENVSEEDQLKAQGILDNESNAQMDAFYKKYPWYDSLPPENDRYFVGFDAEKGLFFVDLYPLKNSPSSISEQVVVLKNEVLTELKRIGVSTSGYDFSWGVIPK